MATDETDGYHRFQRSAKYYGLDVEVFGMHQPWLGGDMANGPGGGHKINLLRENLKKYKDEEDLILMFTDRSFIFTLMLSFLSLTTFTRLKQRVRKPFSYHWQIYSGC